MLTIHVMVFFPKYWYCLRQKMLKACRYTIKVYVGLCVGEKNVGLYKIVYFVLVAGFNVSFQQSKACIYTFVLDVVSRNAST